MPHTTSVFDDLAPRFRRELAGSATAGLSSHRAFLVASTVLFIATAGATIVWSEGMSAMSAMPMPGGWSMSMVWMRTPHESWLFAGASFDGMWMTMMVAMMLPSLVPVLWRYRQAAGGADQVHVELATALVAAGYYAAWALIGIALYAAGATLAVAEMQLPALARAIPLTGGVVVLIAGAMQLTAWKAHQLACCHEVPVPHPPATGEWSSVWQHGVRLGIHCGYCCANLTAVLFALGVMDLRAMAVVTGAITAERLVPTGGRTARAIGIAAVGLGLYMTARAAVL